MDINSDIVGSEQNEASESDINVSDFVKIEHFELEEADDFKDESMKEESKVFKGNQQRPLKSVFETCTKTKQYTTVQTG